MHSSSKDSKHGEEAAVPRNRHRVARIAPESEGLPAVKMFGDLWGVLKGKPGAALASKISANRRSKGRHGTVAEMTNP